LGVAFNNISEANMPRVLMVDFENVQQIDLARISKTDSKVLIFVGSSQSKLPIDLVRHTQGLGARVEWIQIDGTGSNALDFHIAYYLGYQVGKGLTEGYWILSRDKGFDPLVRYLNKQNIPCKRIGTLDEIEPRKEARETSKDYQRILANLTKIEKAKRPRSLKTLKQHMKTIVGKVGSEEVIEQIASRLIKERKIAESAGRIEYFL